MFRNLNYRYRASKNIVSTGLNDRSSATDLTLLSRTTNIILCVSQSPKNASMFPRSMCNHFLYISIRSMVLVDSESHQIKPTTARRGDNVIFELIGK